LSYTLRLARKENALKLNLPIVFFDLQENPHCKPLPALAGVLEVAGSPRS